MKVVVCPLCEKKLASLDVISLANPTQATNINVRPASNNSFAISANGQLVLTWGFHKVLHFGK